MFRRSAAQAPGSAVSLRTTGKQREEHAEDEERDGNKNEQSKKQKKGKEQKKKSMKGIYRATEALRPPPFATSDDPNHPNMRTYFQDGWQHTGNLMPENAFYKDHDSEQDEPDPWIEFDRVANMDSKEFEQEIWDNLEKGGMDIKRWLNEEEYHKTIDKYGLQDISKFKHLCPRMWFELPPSSDEEEEMDQALCMPSEDEPPLPTTDEPFCMKCGSLLGYSDPGLGLKEDFTDPKCRGCGYGNPAGPDGRLLNGAKSTFMHLGTSRKLEAQQEDAIDEMMKEDSDVEEQLRNYEDHRPSTDEKCDECGYGKAYYWTAQVRGMDEGQTTFFECVRCAYVWSIK